MDELGKIMQEAEKEGLEMNRALAGMLADMWRHAKDDVRECVRRARRLFPVTVIAIVAAAIAMCGCIYLGTVVYKQAGEIRAIQKILDNGVILEETTTTEETITVTQDAEDGNNVYQTGDTVNYTQGGGEE